MVDLFRSDLRRNSLLMQGVEPTEIFVPQVAVVLCEGRFCHMIGKTWTLGPYLMARLLLQLAPNVPLTVSWLIDLQIPTSTVSAC